MELSDKSTNTSRCTRKSAKSPTAAMPTIKLSDKSTNTNRCTCKPANSPTVMATIKLSDTSNSTSTSTSNSKTKSANSPITAMPTIQLSDTSNITSTSNNKTKPVNSSTATPTIELSDTYNTSTTTISSTSKGGRPRGTMLDAILHSKNCIISAQAKITHLYKEEYMKSKALGYTQVQPGQIRKKIENYLLLSNIHAILSKNKYLEIPLLMMKVSLLDINHF
jgi:hypothetical protein